MGRYRRLTLKRCKKKGSLDRKISYKCGRRKQIRMFTPRTFISQINHQQRTFGHEDIQQRRSIFEEWSDSVCQIFMGGDPIGSGFLFAHNYILTNAHVVMDYRSNSDTFLIKFACGISRNVYTEGRVVTFYFGYDPFGDWLDYALLELCRDAILPAPLLKFYAPPPKQGQTCIIGYPSERGKRAEYSHINELELYDADNVNIPKILIYPTSMLHGSSGSPGFVDRNLVFMHTGGFPYGDKLSEIRFGCGIPLSLVTCNILLWITQNEDDSQLFLRFISEAFRHSPIPLVADYLRYLVDAFPTMPGLPCKTERLCRVLRQNISAENLQALMNQLAGDTYDEKLRWILSELQDTCDKHHDSEDPECGTPMEID
ncbi:uncharacterized protein LOC108920782 [Scleropages formosus]|uniref:uncharacterized protein LOC108920782 n=1 Tax=Scleropages formosus TaxID=113540 RepID=UPI0010FABB42|nr:uncharacterized protein LOC108920782 [Scleropages formosus]